MVKLARSRLIHTNPLASRSDAFTGQSENGKIRAIFIEKNVEMGSFLPNYPVTVSSHKTNLALAHASYPA